MKKYFTYMRYLLIHKLYVFIASVKMGIIFRGIVHDYSKFFPSEFFPYARFFYNKQSQKNNKGYFKPIDTMDIDFEMAWLKHVHRNDHHWQYWIMPNNKSAKEYEMPIENITEMICDWYGAGKAQNSIASTKEWYIINKEKIVLSKNTRNKVEEILYGNQLFY